MPMGLNENKCDEYNVDRQEYNINNIFFVLSQITTRRTDQAIVNL